MSWLQISVEVPGDRADAVAEGLATAGALSVTILDAGDEPLLEPAPGEMPLWSNTRVIALFEAAQDCVALERQLQACLGVPVPGLVVETLDDCDWSSTWRDTFGAMQFGTRLWICPVGESPPEPEAVVVHMDPGMAFGTGTHATTALCLEWLDAHPPLNRSVIDYGCGSGILAIAAHKLGATEVIAVDIDQQALQATQVNACRNRCDISVCAPAALDKWSAELVLANILANPLIELAADFALRVHSGGQLVLTGILAEQAGTVMAAYTKWFDFAAPVYREEWVLLEGLRL
jgi:ribosomal protein L11 methyltransferase